MKLLFIKQFYLGSFLVLGILVSSCEIKTEEIRYGKDNCEFCKMTIIDQQFATEAVTDKGKVYKFDDLLCMVNYLNAEENAKVNFKHIVVNDYEKSEDFIPVKEATFIKSDIIKSPMAGNIAAFKNPEIAEAFGHETPTHEVISWKDLYTKK